jgi:hypothetical protein
MGIAISYKSSIFNYFLLETSYLLYNSRTNLHSSQTMQGLSFDGNCLFCSLSCSWFHFLQTKPTMPYLPSPFLYPPLDLASAAHHPLLIKAHCPNLLPTSLCLPRDLAPAAGLIKAHCSLSPTPSLCLSLALAFSQILLKARPAKKSCCAIFLFLFLASHPAY